ncbi:MAG: hypothetical protein Q8O40_10720, partial [Chloroflexota bacterium]|nr:hypothetical protein [Chloroflexota bacterium]
MRQRTLRFTAVVAVIVALALAIVLVNPIHLNILGGRLDRTGDGPFGLTLGLDLRGGSHLVYEADAAGVTDEDMDGAVKNIERRINAFGVSEPLVQRLGGERIVIQLPGVRDIEEAKRLIGKTAQLEVKERTCLDAACTPYPDQDKEIGLTGDDLARASPGVESTKGTPIVN